MFMCICIHIYTCTCVYTYMFVSILVFLTSGLVGLIGRAPPPCRQDQRHNLEAAFQAMKAAGRRAARLLLGPYLNIFAHVMVSHSYVLYIYICIGRCVIHVCIYIYVYIYMDLHACVCVCMYVGMYLCTNR